MRKPNFIEVDGRAIDTSSPEWILICLARHICRLPDKKMRHRFLDRLKWPEPSKEELRQIIKIEWQRMYPNNRKKVEAAAHDNA